MKNFLPKVTDWIRKPVFFRRPVRARSSPPIPDDMPRMEAPEEMPVSEFTGTGEWSAAEEEDLTSLSEFLQPDEEPPSEAEIEQRGPVAEDKMPPLSLGAPYSSSEEHIHDELERIDQFVRAAVKRWLRLFGQHKPPEHWGLTLVSEAEMQAFLDSNYLPPGALPPGLERELEPFWERAAELRKEIDYRERVTLPGVDLRLRRLRQLFGLSLAQRDILLVCLLSEMDMRYRQMFGVLRNSASQTRPTVELVRQILQPVREAEDGDDQPENPFAGLEASHLVITGERAGSDDPLPARPIRLDDRIYEYLSGSDGIDARLSPFASVVTPQTGLESLHLPPELITNLRTLAAWWSRMRSQAGFGAAFFLFGPYGSGRQSAAQALCAPLKTPLLLVETRAAQQSELGWERVVALCYREAALQRAAIYWTGCEALIDPSQPGPAWEALVAAAEAYSGVTFFESQIGWDPTGRFLDRYFVRLAFPIPNAEMRKKIWAGALAAERLDDSITDLPALVHDLAAGFQFTEGQIRDAVTTARNETLRRSPTIGRIRREELFEGCRRQADRNLQTFAHRVQPRANLKVEHVILPEVNRRQLMDLLQRIRKRSDVYGNLGFERQLSLGKGLVVLFTGPSGTGKTMTAELIARENNTYLYKVDLSQVVSKYVGQTEQNLRRVFAEAEAASSILFFDEADALFGKRGEVKEAQDRWANMEVNYLLQLVEEYSGVVILASNLQQNIDEAFLRRIQWIVNFPFPEKESRAAIFRGIFPDTVDRPTDEVLEELAGRFTLTGGSIKNVVVDAAFRAREEQEQLNLPRASITADHLALAVAREYQKLGRPILKSEFGGYYNLISTVIFGKKVDN